MKKTISLSCVLLACFETAAHAHPGVGPVAGFSHGFTHPLMGLDHVLAMVGVGLWAAQRGGRTLWALPLSFVGMMLAGWVFGAAGLLLPAVEQSIAASVLILGLLVAGAHKMPSLAACALVGVFAIFHGHAHSTEMPFTASGISYAAGFLTATLLLHAAGVALCASITRQGQSPVVRFTGGAIAACGLYLCLLTA